MLNSTASPRFRTMTAAAVVAGALFAAASLFTTGCDPKPADSGTPAAPYGNAAPSPSASPAPAEAPPVAANVPAMAGGAPSSSAPGGPVGAAPFMGMGDPTAPLTATPAMDKAIADAEKGTDKKAIAAAYTARGIFRMNDDKAGARVKYRASLDDYRAALKADPTNADAKKNKEMIEGIYKSMGRPIPGADGK